jgi:hypothetical protein
LVSYRYGWRVDISVTESATFLCVLNLMALKRDVFFEVALKRDVRVTDTWRGECRSTQRMRVLLNPANSWRFTLVAHDDITICKVSQSVKHGVSSIKVEFNNFGYRSALERTCIWEVEKLITALCPPADFFQHISWADS